MKRRPYIDFEEGYQIRILREKNERLLKKHIALLEANEELTFTFQTEIVRLQEEIETWKRRYETLKKSVKSQGPLTWHTH